MSNKGCIKVSVKKRGFPIRDTIILQNSRPHTIRQTRKKFEDLSQTVMEHPPYSPDLSLGVHHMFGSLKEEFEGHRFDDTIAESFVCNLLLFLITE